MAPIADLWLCEDPQDLSRWLVANKSDVHRENDQVANESDVYREN